jgi:hypothetical protein
MSDPYANVIVERKEIQMIVRLTNGTVVSLHWNDRYYEATCSECGEDVFAKTTIDIAELLDIHC